MAAGVSVTGMPREMGGLRESMSAFRKHHHEVGDALLNISGVGTIDGQPADKDEPRQPYVRQDYPKMVYHADGREEICATQADFNALRPKGFRAEPYPKVQIAMADPKAEKVALQKSLAEKDGQLATMADMLSKMQAQIDALAKK
jgi:hypothetical protein